MVNIAKFLKRARLNIGAIFLFLWLLLPALSCNESSARHDAQKYVWEHPEPLNAADTLLAYRVDTFFQHRVKHAGLNGAVLVAHNGKIIYQNRFGFSDYKQKSLLTDSATFQLASVSKPLTATAILILHERKQLSIDEPVSKYIKGFPYENITVRELLNHRSGLANYIYLFDTMKLRKDSFITNQDVVNYFVEFKPALQATPGHRFQYCNTNYALLAYIVEVVSGQLFPVFMEENIFTPAHMHHTYVRDMSNAGGHHNQTLGYMGTQWTRVEDVPYDGVTGDKGIYTTTWDLYLFDQALNHGVLLNAALLDEAYKGYSYEKPGQKNYGLGWRLKEFEDSSRIIYHNGWWRGYNTLFVRKPEQGTCIIVLANKFNRSVYNVAPLYEMLGLKAGEKEEGEE